MTTQTGTSIASAWLPRQEVAPLAAQLAWDRYFARHPVMAQIYDITGRLAEIVGPMCWAALIVLFVRAMTLGPG